MEFQTLKRRELQVLCKKNNIPANTTNAAMADALAALPFVEGMEEFLGQTETKDVSPERSVITSPNMPRTSTRHRVRIEESECSNLATRTRCSTRRTAVAGTESKQTPATRTSRRTNRKIQHDDMQAEYEASLEESEVSENNEVLSTECESVEESKLSTVVEQDDNVSSEIQSDSQDQVYDQEEVVSEELNDNPKVDFHSLSRKQLQNLCKRNKIPANITNAAMIDALEALESVEGLEDLLKDSDPLAIMSPQTSQMTKPRARQSQTARKTTCLKTTQTRSALGKMSVPKKDDSLVQSLAKEMDSTVEDIDCSVSISTAEDVMPKEVENDEGNHRETVSEKPEVLDCVSENKEQDHLETVSQKPEVLDCVSENEEENHLETVSEKPEVLDCVSENDSGVGSESKSSEKCSDGSETSIIVETPMEPLVDGFNESSNPADIVSSDDALVHEENPLEIENASQEDALKTDGDDQELEADEYVEFAVDNESLEPNTDEGESQLLLDEVSTESDSSLRVENVEEFTDDVIENEIEGENDSSERDVHDSDVELASKPVAEEKGSDVVAEEEISSEALFEKPVGEDVGLMPETPLETEGFEVSDNSTQEDEAILQDEDAEGDDMEISNQLEERLDEKIDETEFGNMNTRDSDAAVEVVGDMENLEDSKSISDSTSQDEDESFDSDSVESSMEEQESSCLDINTDKESEICQEKSDELVIAANECEVEKQESGCVEDQMTLKFRSELISKPTEHAPKQKGTPLNHKSLRKLKMMLKERLQATTLLTSQMEKLTLAETDVAPVQEACQNLNEDCDKIETSCLPSTTVLGIAEAVVPEKVTDNDDLDEEPTQTMVDKAVNDPIIDAATTEIQISAESVNSDTTLKVEGNDENEKQTTQLRKTPSKSSSKTTMSAGRKNQALDMTTNKENIDKSGSKTIPVKTEMAAVFGTNLLSPISMRKLKKELQQQSEKKRIALKSRSENQCPVSSP